MYKIISKYVRLTLAIVCCSQVATAQTSAKDSVLNVIAKEVCTEIEKKDFSGKSSDELNMALGLVILPSISSRLDVLEKYFGDDMSGEGLKKVGEAVGVKMAVTCPAFMKIFSQNQDLLKSSDNNGNGENSQHNFSGTLQKIVPGEFTFFLVKDPDGNIEKIWWMEYFDGADKLSDALLNKPVVITYNVRQTYNAQLKQYNNIKVAAKVQLIQ